MMPPIQSKSQAAQDLFVAAILARPEDLYDGSFLDIGCCHPTELSNTFALEQLGWRGLLIDNDPGAIDLCGKYRLSPAVLGDSTKLDLGKLIEDYIEGEPVDYLSLDVDSATLDTLRNLMKDCPRFRVITIETDQYRFGDLPRFGMREILKAKGYRLVCADVRAATGEIFEDWWIDPRSVPLERYERFICDGKKWTEIFPP